MQLRENKILGRILVDPNNRDVDNSALELCENLGFSSLERGAVKFSLGSNNYLVTGKNIHKADHIEVCDSLKGCYILKDGDIFSVYHMGRKIFESNEAKSCRIIVTDTSNFFIDTDTKMYLFKENNLFEIFSKTN